MSRRPELREAHVRLFVLAFNMGLAVGIDFDMQRHRMAADGAILDVVLMRPS
jgi:hypothetical protein